MNGKTRRLAALGLALSVAFAAGPAVRAQGFTSMLRSDGFDFRAALQRAALKLFPPKQGGTIYDVRMKERVELHTQGVEVETYGITWNLEPVGEFLRLKLVLDTQTHLDYALRLEGGRIVRAVPMRVVFVSGHPVLGGEGLFAPFEKMGTGDFGPAMGALCDSLLYLERLATAEAQGPKMSDGEFEKLSKALYASLPKPDAALPAFEARTVEGRKIDGAAFRGKKLVAFFGSVTDEDDREMIDTIAAFARTHGDRCSFVFFLGDRPAYLERYLAREKKTLPGHVVLDFEEAQKALFKVPTTPHLLAYDGGRLCESTYHAGPAETARALSRFSARSLGGPWRDRTLPASARARKGAPADEERLRVVARSLFPLASESRLPRVVPGEVQAIYTQGLTVQDVQVFDGAASRGRMQRVRVEFGKGGMVDCAFRLHEGKIQGARLVTPLKAGKLEVDEIGPVFAPFRAVRAERYGPALACLFRGVGHLHRVARGEEKGDAASYRPDEIVNVVKVEQPRPALGEAVPTFALADMAARPFTGRELAGRPALIVLGKLRDAITLEMRVEVDRFIRVHRKKLAFVEIFEDPVYIVQDAMDRGMEFSGTVVSDEKETARTMLKAPYVPYLFAYDRTGRLAAFGPYQGKMQTRSFLAAWAKKHLQK